MLCASPVVVAVVVARLLGVGQLRARRELLCVVDVDTVLGELGVLRVVQLQRGCAPAAAAPAAAAVLARQLRRLVAAASVRAHARAAMAAVHGGGCGAERDVGVKVVAVHLAVVTIDR